MYYGFSYIYLIIPPLLLSLYASYKVKSTFSKYSKIDNSRGLSGVQAAQIILNQNGLDLPISKHPGHLTDHYDPIKRTLALSESVYDQTNIAALAVAAHEVGHALQHQASYPFLWLRTYIYPVVGFSSKLAPVLIIIGFFVFPAIIWAGIAFYAMATLFTVITLPVEFDASRRAMKSIDSLGLLSDTEAKMARKVLTAAALTYVAATLASVAELVRLVLMARDR